MGLAATTTNLSYARNDYIGQGRHHVLDKAADMIYYILTNNDIATTYTNTITVGADGAGHDVKFFGDTSGAYFEWDADTDTQNIVNGKLVVDATWTTVGATGRPFYVVLATDAQLGSYANAFKAQAELGATGGATGLLSVACLELELPTGAGIGTLSCLELEMTAPSSGYTGAAQNPSFIYFNATGTTVGGFLDYGVLFHLDAGMAADTGNIVGTGYSTLRIGFDQQYSTLRYIPLSTAEGTFTFAYPIVSTYAGGIGFSSAFSTGTSGYSGVRNVSTFTLATAGVHKGIQSDVTYSGTGYGTSIGVAGKVLLTGTFQTSAGYMWGVQGQMDFRDGCTVNEEGSVFCGGRFVLTEENKDGWTHTDGWITCLRCDSLLQTSVTTTQPLCIAQFGNWGGSSNFATFDATFMVYGRYTTNLFYFYDCDAADSFITAETSDPAGEWTHKIKVHLNNGSLTRYIMLCTDPS